MSLTLPSPALDFQGERPPGREEGGDTGWLASWSVTYWKEYSGHWQSRRWLTSSPNQSPGHWLRGGSMEDCGHTR